MNAHVAEGAGVLGGPLAGLLCYSLLPLFHAAGPDWWGDFTQ